MTHTRTLAKVIAVPLVAAKLAFGCANKAALEPMAKPAPVAVASTLVATLKPGESTEITSGAEKAKLSFLKVLSRDTGTFAIVRVKACLNPINIVVPVDGKPFTYLVPGNHSLATYIDADSVKVIVTKLYTEPVSVPYL